MQLKSLKYSDHTSGWSLETITFKNLTLLVGASGSGKTQILEAIMNLRKIVEGHSLSGLAWAVEFATSNGSHYRWEGAFDAAQISYENLYLGDKKIILRDTQEIFFNDVKTIKLPQHQSVLNLLREEALIGPAYQGFLKISLHQSPSNWELNAGSSVRDIQESGKTIKTKLYLVFVNAKATFDEITQRFIEIFPQVEEVRFESEKAPPILQIKHTGVSEWISERQISAGMLKSLLYISDLYLCAEGTVNLFDEFENSLGVNCIDQVTHELLSHQRNLQFIITSHHPYIINNIPSDYWKIITRQGGVIRAREAKEYSLGKSKHEAFIQLINLEEYATGRHS